MLTARDIEWIRQHRSDDATRLRLRHGGDQAMSHLIMQVECRRKHARKLSYTLQCEAFEFPTALSGEQATSDILAQFHASLIAPGAVVADLTAGLGIDTLHLARRAQSVTAIERDPAVASALHDNAVAMGCDNVSVVTDDCNHWLQHSAQGPFTDMFIDPARRGLNGERLFALSQCAPDVTLMLDSIRRHSRRLIVKMSPMLDIAQVARELPGMKAIYTIGTHDECKELVADVDLQSTAQGPYTIHAVTIGTDGRTTTLTYESGSNDSSPAAYGLPDGAAYLYEPYPAVMKTSPFRLLAQRFGITSLHPNTHLYTSPGLVPDFPGSIFAITAVMPLSSSTLRHLQRRHIQASVTTRNLNMTAEQLRKRLKCAESSSTRLFGVTVLGTDPPQQLIVAQALKQ